MVKDYRRQLVDYFKKNLSKAYTADTLKFALINQGYSRSIVDYALEQANKEMAVKAPVLKEKPKIKHEIFDENNRVIVMKKPWWKFW